jgi:radical SAM superfamily enzyme YgiQ (UPF0313 family)
LIDVKRYPDTNLNTSRGGSYRCTFFPEMADLEANSYCLSAGRLASQVEKLHRQHRVNHFYFSDPCFAANGERLRQACATVIGKKLKMTWNLTVSGSLDDETIRLMARAGCVSVLLEVGSGSQRMRDFLKKGKVAEVEKTFWLLVKRRIIPTLFVMYDYPTETAADFQETLGLLHRLDQPPCLYMRYIPYPGTTLFKYCLDKSLITFPRKLEEWAAFQHKCLSEYNLSQVPQKLMDDTLAGFRKTYASRRVRFMLRHHPGYFLSIIGKPLEFYRRAKDLIRYYVGIVLDRKTVD